MKGKCNLRLLKASDDYQTYRIISSMPAFLSVPILHVQQACRYQMKGMVKFIQSNPWLATNVLDMSKVLSVLAMRLQHSSKKALPIKI